MRGASVHVIVRGASVHVIVRGASLLGHCAWCRTKTEVAEETLLSHRVTVCYYRANQS